MTLDITQLQSVTYKDFSGGLVEDVSTFSVQDNQIVSAKNIAFSSFGGMQTRPGSVRYTTFSAADTINPNNIGVVQPIRGIHRYIHSDGTRQTWVYSGDITGTVERTGIVYRDDNDGQWTEMVTVLSSDGYLRFEQHKDALFMCADRRAQRAVYGKDAAVWKNPQWVVGLGYRAFDSDVSSPGITNRFGTYTNYIYRFTYDISIGGQFIMETGPLYSRLYDENNQYSPTYIQEIANVTGSGNRVNITKSDFTVVSSINDIQDMGGAQIDRINIYRKLSNSSASNANTEQQHYKDFYWIGSVSADDWDAAADAADLFYDDGISVVNARQLKYDGLVYPPYARFQKIHKGRMWYAHTYTVPNTSQSDADHEYEPSRVYFSDFSSRGVLPLNVKPFNFVDIAPEDGEPITGIEVAKDGSLLVFKPNSIWAIRGGDGFVGASDDPAIVVRNVSRTIGCIAPETIRTIDEGTVFLSSLGMYITTGSSLPISLDENRVQNHIVDATPARKYNACVGYDERRKEVWLAYTHPDTGGKYNRSISLFSKKNRNWTRYDMATGTTLADSGDGIEIFSNERGINEVARFVAGRGDVPARALSHGPLMYLNQDFKDAGGREINWSVQTPFYNLGYPQMNKDFQYVLFYLKSVADLTLHVVCDNRIDTQTDAGGGFTIPIPQEATVGVWDATDGNPGPVPANTLGWDNVDWGGTGEGYSLVRLDDRIWGHRISLIVSGDTLEADVDIQSITIYYLPKEGVRYR